jgi:hypothetical protein
MSTIHTYARMAAILALGSCLIANEASAERRMGGAAQDVQRMRKGCHGVVVASHPGLKGAAFKAEFDKCVADPSAYSKS